MNGFETQQASCRKPTTRNDATYALTLLLTKTKFPPSHLRDSFLICRATSHELHRLRLCLLLCHLLYSSSRLPSSLFIFLRLSLSASICRGPLLFVTDYAFFS